MRFYLEAAKGLIPARAGNTETNNTGYPRRRAHPRSRGEHLARSSLVRALLGSSPLARGTHYPRRGGRAGSGLIPARAGNTHCPDARRCRPWAHPRSRGEH